MDETTDLKDLYAALSKAQAAVMEAKEDGKNPHLNTKYATLSSVWDACRKPLTDNGICIIQLPVPATVQGCLRLRTIIGHTSGQSMTSELEIPVGGKGGPQEYGAALTYARRYALSAAVGVCPDEDLDGKEPAPAPPRRQEAARQEQQRVSTPPARQECARAGEQAPSYSQASGAGTPHAGQSTGGGVTATPVVTSVRTETNAPLVCSTDGCGVLLTTGQSAVSNRAFGKMLCPSCQRNAPKVGA